MQEDIFNPYNLFKIPELTFESHGIKKKVIIGLIDASGSMGSFWASMAKFWNQKIAPDASFLITFSHTAKLEQTTYLNESISKHGGGMTNILAAFNTLQVKLKQVEQQASITIVFISDGQDTVNGQSKLVKEMLKLKGGLGRDINFLCLGIQSGFPTKIAMNLRQLYHTGDETIPAIYLIQYASQKAFFNKFQTMSNCFKTSNSIKIQIGGDYIKEYPWQKNGQFDFKEGKWMMVHKQFPQIQVTYNQTQKRKFLITSLKQIPLDQIVDCFRGWIQKIQMISLDNSKMQSTKIIANETANIIKNYTLQYQKIFNIYILSQRKIQKQSFKDRAMSLAVKNTGSRIKWFIDQLIIIGKGLGIGQLNQYEAAKRLGIGTITGKYHQKALALKGITMQDFLVIKNQFGQIFKRTKLSKEPSKQQCSIFTLQNQKQVFQQPDFLQGLQFCKTQYDLVQTFPVVGYGLKVKRFDGSLINPWKVQLMSLAKTHKSIDSMYLAKNSNKYELSIGEGQVEQINAVLPLFYLEDGEMSQLFNSRLFKLAVSFMVVQNIDTYHEQAYLSLLGTTFIFLLNQKQSQWRKDLLELIYSSLKVTYGATQQFMKFIYSIQQNPFKLFVAKQKQDHVDIVKVLLIIYFIYKQGRISQQKVKHLVQLSLVHYCQKTYVQNQFKIFRVADIKFQEENKSLIKEGDKKQEEEHIEDINLIKNDDQLKKIVDQKMKTLLNLDCVKIQLSQKIFTHQIQDRRVTYTTIKSFYELLLKTQLKQKQILFYFGHYLKGKTDQNYNSKISKEKQELQKQILCKVDLKNLGHNQSKQIKQIRKRVEEKYLDHFQGTHFGIVPLTKDHLIQQCIRTKASFNDFDYNQSTGMLRNSCLSPNCLYYLKVLTPKEMHDHLKLWRGRIPARFHMTVVYLIKQKKDTNFICQHVFKSNIVNIKRHRKNQAFVKEYIDKIRKALEK